jgi:hypothetical protein
MMPYHGAIAITLPFGMRLTRAIPVECRVVTAVVTLIESITVSDVDRFSPLLRQRTADVAMRLYGECRSAVAICLGVACGGGAHGTPGGDHLENAT